MGKTLLTGEPLSWQLSNEQRLSFGLAPVEDHWTLHEVPCGILADCETYVYMEENRIMRVISCGEHTYEEGCFDVHLTDDGRIAPVKPDGRSIPLTAANLHKRRALGVHVDFHTTTTDAFFQVEDHGKRCVRENICFYGGHRMTVEDFAGWLSDWQTDSLGAD